MQESDADIIVANDIGRKGSEAGSDKNEVFIIDKDKKILHLPLENKAQVANKLLEIVAEAVDRRLGQEQ